MKQVRKYRVTVEIGGKVHEGVRIVEGTRVLRQTVGYGGYRMRDFQQYEEGQDELMARAASSILIDLIDKLEGRLPPRLD